MANSYTLRVPAVTNPVSATQKTFFTLFNNLGSTNVVRIYRAWFISTNVTTAAGGTAGWFANYTLDKFTAASAPGGGTAVALINHDSRDPFWPTAAATVITGTTYASPTVTFFTTATASATITAVTATTATPFFSTVTTSAAHGFTAGQNVTIAGMTPAGFNGTYRVMSVPTTTTFVIKVTGNPGTATVFGTAIGGHSYQIGQNVVVTGVTSTGAAAGGTFNNTFSIASIPASNQFTATMGTISPGTWSSGGSVAPAITALNGNTAITGTQVSLCTYRQFARSTMSNIVSTALVGSVHLQSMMPLSYFWDTGYSDSNVEPIILRGGEGIRLMNQSNHSGGTWPTTAASVDLILEMTIT